MNINQLGSIKTNKMVSYLLEEELAIIWTNTASLYAEFSKVCAVSLTFLNKDGDKLLCKEFYGDDELKLMTDLGLF